MKEIVKVLNQIVFFCATVYFILGVYEVGEQILSYVGWIVASAVCTYLIRQNMSKLSAFLLGHFLLAVVGVGLIKLFELSGGFLAVLIVLILFSVSLRILVTTDLLEEPGYVHLGVLALCSVISVYMDLSERVISGVMLAFFATLLLKVFYGNLKATDEFIRNRAASTRMDEQRLRRLNVEITLLYTGILGGILAIVRLFRTEGISRVILSWVRRILQFVFGGLEALSEKSEPEIVDDAVTSIQPNMGNMEVPETSPIWRILDVLIGASGIIIVVVGMILIAVFLFRAIYRHFYYHQNQPEDAEDYVEPLTMRKKLTKGKQKKFLDTFDRSPAKKIRRIYRKSFKTFGPSGNLEYLSPAEQMESLAEKSSFVNARREEILMLYEKARYSESETTEAEAKRMQELLRG